MPKQRMASVNLSESQGLIATLRAARGFSQGAFNYGLSVVTTRAQMFSFLLTEREIEFAMEGKRYWDLRRTRQFDKLTGTQRLALKLGVVSPYLAGVKPASPVAGKIYMDVIDPTTGARVCDTINVNARVTYRKFFTPSIITIEPSTAPVINYPTNYYFYPLPQILLTSNPSIQQNIGWRVVHLIHYNNKNQVLESNFKIISNEKKFNHIICSHRTGNFGSKLRQGD